MKYILYHTAHGYKRFATERALSVGVHSAASWSGNLDEAGDFTGEDISRLKVEVDKKTKKVRHHLQVATRARLIAEEIRE